MTKIDFIFLLLVARILGEDKITLSERDIFDLMNSELKKSEEEIDTKLIEFCIDTLDGKFGEPFEI